jgi:hypothetical protein
VRLAALPLTRGDAPTDFAFSLVACYRLSLSCFPSASDSVLPGAVNKTLSSPSADAYLPSTLVKCAGAFADHRALERDPFSVHINDFALARELTQHAPPSAASAWYAGRALRCSICLVLDRITGR